MGTQHTDFRPLAPAEAERLDAIITQASQCGEVVVIDPDRGVTGSKGASLISPNTDLGGVVRFKRHYHPSASS